MNDCIHKNDLLITLHFLRAIRIKIDSIKFEFLSVIKAVLTSST